MAFCGRGGWKKGLGILFIWGKIDEAKSFLMFRLIYREEFEMEKGWFGFNIKWDQAMCHIKKKILW